MVGSKCYFMFVTGEAELCKTFIFSALSSHKLILSETESLKPFVALH